jgi:tRNA-specific 2-thiouridylase
MKRLTAIALSGGIDSLVAAHLLKEQGHEIIGIHFLTGHETQSPDDHQNITRANTDTANLSVAKSRASNKLSYIADQLDIEVKIIDCSNEFKSNVVDYFIQTYQAGKTPNPCMVCNPSIKFGTVFEFARKLGASTLATGHYARINSDNMGKFHLLKGVDPKKDQSYFLALLTQQQLAGACFPLGDMIKSDVVKLAAKKGLKSIKRKESQDVCFIRDKNYGTFLAQQPKFEPTPGLIKNVSGSVLGKHKGLHLFTIGQRRGINCPASEPYYVVSMDTGKNLLTVGFKNNLLASECRVKNIHWIRETPSHPIKVYTRLRYRHKAAASKLFPVNGKTAIVRFESPQTAITPGQCAVFYRDDEVLGGGWIAPIQNI